MTDTTRLIPLLLLIPLVGGLALAWLPNNHSRVIRTTAMLWSLLTLAVSLAIVSMAYQPTGAPGGGTWLETGDLIFRSSIPWVQGFGLKFAFGIDSISLWLIMLTTCLMPLVILGSFTAVHDRLKEYYIWLLLLEAAMIGTFVATDLIFFYICFEFTLVPMYFLIGIFGSTQRLRAAKVFFLYTFTGSMLTFAGVLYVAWFNYSQTGAWSFSIAQLVQASQNLSVPEQKWVLLALLAGFAVKVPLFPVHTWLPLAHTEAPTAGSVVLAGVLLKLGTYGLLRFALPMTPVAAVIYAPYIGVFAVIGILYTALICWVQKDVKKLIAYSSVSHLGFCVLGMFALNNIGVSASVMYMINHGISTGALFLCIGMIYERFHTREMARMGGLARVMPIWSTFMVFFCLASVGLPGLNGFIGEFLALLGVFTATDVLGVGYAVAAGFGMILGAIYILYMIGKVIFGPVLIPTHDDSSPTPTAHAQPQVADLNLREIITLLPLAVACLALGLFPTPLLETLEAPVSRLIEPARLAMAGRPYTQNDQEHATTIILIDPTITGEPGHALEGSLPSQTHLPHPTEPSR